MKKCNVSVDGQEKEYEKGTTFLRVAKDHQQNYKNDIIMAVRNGKLIELNKKINMDCTVSFFTTADDIGHKTYLRGVTMLMLKAVYSEIGNENIDKVCIHYAVGYGYYCSLKAEVELNQEILNRIEQRMYEYIKEDIPFTKKSVNTEDAVDLFRTYRMYDKEKLFRYRRSSRVNLYSLGHFEDYFYGSMPPSTGILKLVKLKLYEKGFVFIIPDKKDPKVLPEFKPFPKLYATLQESSEWGKMMEVDTVGALNDVIANGRIQELILVQEALHEKKIAEIAGQIAAAKDKRFIMVAGPSSSGKTTFSHRLSTQLSTFGLKPHPIPIDNYFVDRVNTPVDEDGNINYECLEAIDVELFNRDMNALLNGEEVELPHYNFITGIREYKGDIKRLEADDILVIEGIHGLNDQLSYSLPKESKFKIYISALTQLNVDEHNRIPTTDGRLIRRMIRDARTRGASSAQTISMWKSVRKGEDNYIFPFQEEADAMFNSALIYELAILKQYAEPLLFRIDKESDEYMEAKRLLKFLDYFICINSEDVPRNSILREFIGSSVFKV